MFVHNQNVMRFELRTQPHRKVNLGHIYDISLHLPASVISLSNIFVANEDFDIILITDNKNIVHGQLAGASEPSSTAYLISSVFK